jgi:hypothetical protein
VPTRPCLSASVELRDHGRTVAQMGQRFLNRKKRAFEMNVAERIKKFLRQTLDWRKFRDAGIGDEDVELAKSLGG